MRTLSQLQTDDGYIAALKWKEGKLFFSLYPEPAAEEYPIEEHTVEVTTLEDKLTPPAEAKVLPSAWTDQFYIVAGDHTFRSRCRGKSWEQLY